MQGSFKIWCMQATTRFCNSPAVAAHNLITGEDEKIYDIVLGRRVDNRRFKGPFFARHRTVVGGCRPLISGCGRLEAEEAQVGFRLVVVRTKPMPCFAACFPWLSVSCPLRCSCSCSIIEKPCGFSPRPPGLRQLRSDRERSKSAVDNVSRPKINVF